MFRLHHTPLLLTFALLLTPRLSADETTWSLQPLQRPAVPVIAGDIRNPIDAFVLAKLREKGLDFAPEADRATLIRRVTIDLTGLPPTFEEVRTFVADADPLAYERLIDRLLASPRYGERWARHWLDVAHYADTHGQDQDRPRPNSWPYRDYLIRSFNADKPYSRFVQEQVAGDALFPTDPDAIVATGFLAAGPWDESSLRDIQENSLDREIARYLDRDDIVTSVMSTFVSSTVGCARCHDHKFDPISQEDYYALQAVFSGVDKSDRAYDADPVVARRRVELLQSQVRLKAWKGKPEPALLSAENQSIAVLFEKELAATNQKWVILDPIEAKSSHGATLKELPDHSVLSTGMRPEKDTYTITLGTDIADLTGLKLEVLSDDGLPLKGPGRQDNGNLHLSEIRVRIGSTNVKLQNPVADFDQDGWAIPRALDGNVATAWGIYPAIGQAHQAVFEFVGEQRFPNGAQLTVELDQLHGGGHLIGRFRLSVTSSPRPLSLNAKPISAELQAILTSTNRTDAQRAELARLALENRVERELATLPAQQKVYCASNVFAPDGSFRPSPMPRMVSLLKRGDVTKPIKLIEPGTMSAVQGLPSRFAGLDATRESERRIALAKWLTDAKNPLTWRSIANRVFHYHIGKGIADTPNDLGKMGGKPSHPELLDWLAVEIRETQSLKHLHRLILTSRTYRQSCRHDPKAASLDGDNRLLWRMNRGRLDAESVRDAVLQSSGQLDSTMYGVPVQHFLMKPGIHVTPLINYETFDVDSMGSRRRSIYRFIFRTRPDPFLEVLDCPDASQSAPVRSNSVSPLQALALWNDKFLTRYSEHLASVVTLANADLSEQVKLACERVLGRSPSDDEQRAFVEYATKHGLPNLCRVLFNSSEFLFVD